VVRTDAGVLGTQAVAERRIFRDGKVFPLMRLSFTTLASANGKGNGIAGCFAITLVRIVFGWSIAAMDAKDAATISTIECASRRSMQGDQPLTTVFSSMGEHKKNNKKNFLGPGNTTRGTEPLLPT